MQPARGRFARFDLDRQIASTFPAHWKVGPAPFYYGSSSVLLTARIFTCDSNYNIHTE